MSEERFLREAAAFQRALQTPEFQRSMARAQGFAREAVNSQALVMAQVTHGGRTSLLAVPTVQLQQQILRALNPLTAQATERQGLTAQRLSKLLAISEVGAAVEAVRQLIEVRPEATGEDDFERVEVLARADVLDEETVGRIEDAVAEDEALLNAVEQAADAISKPRPGLDRALARKMVVVWVYLIWTALTKIVIELLGD